MGVGADRLRRRFLHRLLLHLLLLLIWFLLIRILIIRVLLVRILLIRIWLLLLQLRVGPVELAVFGGLADGLEFVLLLPAFHILVRLQHA